MSLCIAHLRLVVHESTGFPEVASAVLLLAPIWYCACESTYMATTTGKAVVPCATVTLGRQCSTRDLYSGIIGLKRSGYDVRILALVGVYRLQDGSLSTGMAGG